MSGQIYTLILLVVGAVFGFYLGRASRQTDMDTMSFKVLKLEMELDITIRRLNAEKRKWNERNQTATVT